MKGPTVLPLPSLRLRTSAAKEYGAQSVPALAADSFMGKLGLTPWLGDPR